MNISGSCVIRTVIVLCLPLPSVWHLSFISKLKAGSVSKVKVVSANTDTILVAINRRSNTNIMRVIRLTNGKSCRGVITCGYIIFMTWRSCDIPIHLKMSRSNTITWRHQNWLCHVKANYVLNQFWHIYSNTSFSSMRPLCGFQEILQK